VPRAVLISTYDMGRQPFGLASPAAWLREADVEVTCLDLAKAKLDEDAIRGADLVGFFLPMHTATRLALPVVDRVRRLNPGARLVAYGLYAPLNAGLLRDRGVTDILGGEFEDDLVNIVRPRAPGAGEAGGRARGTRRLPHLAFRVPERADLPPLSRYATLQVGDERRAVGYTEASRGCKHRCRHCPIVPVYEGAFRLVPHEVVLADIRNQVANGARHVTFGDPDFFNAVAHATALVEAVALEFPGVTYDATIKVEHLLRHADRLPTLRRTGCAFVTSAVESLDDAVLAKLEKGHTRADFEQVVALCRAGGLPLAPTFVAFTPWTTLDGYVDLVETIARLDLVEHVAPIQLAIRLLIPNGSLMLDLDDVRARISHYDPRSLAHAWRHPDPRVDALQRDVEALVGTNLGAARRTLFARIRALAHARAGLPALAPEDAAPPRATVPYLNEPWYC
jgi:radical SAM superfamily enzyme YgiQ (UPF0313 family)